MINLSIEHFQYSYEKMDSGKYARAHWFASFGLYAILKSYWFYLYCVMRSVFAIPLSLTGIEVTFIAKSPSFK